MWLSKRCTITEEHLFFLVFYPLCSSGGWFRLAPSSAVTQDDRACFGFMENMLG